MNARVTIGQSVVLKRFSSPRTAKAAFDRAAALAKAGIATPIPVRSDELTLRFPRVHGDSGKDLIGAVPDLLAPLARLHRLDLCGLDLPPYDPLARIRPRLSMGPGWMQDRIGQIIARLPANPRTPCHGDFHPSQVIRDADGLSWLLDLDDLSLGPVEADLGNLIAWLATQPAPSIPSLDDRLKHARHLILVEWETMASHINPHVLQDYTALATIRRALKQAEKGDPSFLSQIEALA